MVGLRFCFDLGGGWDEIGLWNGRLMGVNFDNGFHSMKC